MISEISQLDTKQSFQLTFSKLTVNEIALIERLEQKRCCSGSQRSCQRICGNKSNSRNFTLEPPSRIALSRT